MERCTPTLSAGAAAALVDGGRRRWNDPDAADRHGVCWLTLIFASFGYRSPRNVIAATSFVVAALLISGALYLILDMDKPTSGLIQASDRPLRHALSELQH